MVNEKVHKTYLTNYIWNLSNICHLLGMSTFQTMQVSICLIIIRRVDCLTGPFTHEIENFYLAHKEKLSEERLDSSIREICQEFKFYNISGYDLNDVLVLNQPVEITFRTYVQGFSRNIIEILNGLNFDSNVAVLQRHSTYLVQVLEQLAALDLSEDACSIDEFSEILVWLISRNSSQQENQAYATSPVLQKLMVECLLSKDYFRDKLHNTSIYNPVCGTGSLLVTAADRMDSLRHKSEHIDLLGQEGNVSLAAISRCFVLFRGGNDSYIQCRDSLVEDAYAYEKFQYMLAELPFGLPWRHLRNKLLHQDRVMDGEASYGLPAMTNLNDSQYLYINHMVSKMDPEGSRIAFISTGSVLTMGLAKSGESRLRRRLFENDMVETIINLPSNSLPFTAVPVYLWILTNRKELYKKGKVQLIQVESKVLKNREGLTPSIVNEILEAYQNYAESGISRIVSNDGLGQYDVTIRVGHRKDNISVPLDTDIEKYLDREVRPFNKEQVMIDYGSVDKRYNVCFNQFFTNQSDSIETVGQLEKDIIDIVDAMSELQQRISTFNRAFIAIQKQGYSDDDLAPKVMPFYCFAEMVQGQRLYAGKTVEREELPYVDVKFLRGGKVVEVTRQYAEQKVCTFNDTLLITRGANAGEVFNGVRGVTASSLMLIRPEEKWILPKYLYYLLKGNEQMLRAASDKGTGIASLTVTKLRQMKFPVPAITVQQILVDELDKVISWIDHINDLLGHSDNTLAHYRQALIEKVVVRSYDNAK